MSRDKIVRVDAGNLPKVNFRCSYHKKVNYVKREIR
jgi:hypothetical protein